MTEPLARRTVVQAAWVAPVVVAAAAAPSYAASGAAVVAATLVPPVRVTTSLPITSTLANTGTAPTIDLQVTLRIEITAALTTVGITSSEPPGFTLTSTSYAGNTVVLFAFDAVTEIAANGAATFAPTVTIGNTGALTPSGNAQVIPTVGTPGTATASTRQSFS